MAAKKKRVARGKLTAKQLNDLSAISAEDVERAKLAFEEDAPAEWKNLLSAEPDDEEE